MLTWFSETVTKRNAFLLLVVAGMITLFDRLFLVTGFHFLITDIDQLIQWHGATDYSQGVFHEPYFYGQNYNPMLEALLAVPMLWSGVHVAQALPIVTMVLSLLPFLLFSIAFIRKEQWLAAALTLAWPALLSVEYGIIANLSRGFVTGIGIAGFSAFCMIDPTSKRSIILLSIILPLALLVCPNSIILFGLIVPLLWSYNVKRPIFYLLPMVMLVLGSLLQLYAQSFYSENPAYFVVKPWNAFRPIWIWAAFRDGEVITLLQNLLPFISRSGLLVLPLMIALTATLLFTVNKRYGLALLLCTFACIIALGHSRVYVGMDQVFFPLVRNWLAIPVVMAVSLGWCVQKVRVTNWMLISVIVLALGNSSYKTVNLDATARELADQSEGQVVPHAKITDLSDECDRIGSICKDHSVDLIMLSPFMINLGCPLLIDSYPNTISSLDDRLTWNLEGLGNQKFSRIMLYGSFDASKIPATIRHEFISRSPQIIIVRGFDGTALELMAAVGVHQEHPRRILLTRPHSDARNR